MHYPWLTEREIDLAAERLRLTALGAREPLAKVPLDDIVFDYLCEAEEMSFDDECELGTQGGDVILGRMYPLRGRVELNRSLKAVGAEGRYRFTLAHEIGHWVLHRPLFLARAGQTDLFANDEPEYLVSLARSVFPARGQVAVAPEEWQANRFAVALLIHPELLRGEFVRRFGEPPISVPATQGATIRDQAMSLAGQSVRGMAPLWELFGLSRTAMAVALERSGYVTGLAPLL